MRKLIFLFTLLITGLNVYADEVSFTASAPDAVVSGEQFRLTYTINTQNVREFRAPAMKGFDVLMGPTRSSQSSTQIINGKMSSSSSITFTYILMAGQEGTYKISGASVVADGKAALSNSLTIKVLPPDKANGIDNGGNTSSSRTQSSSTGVSNAELFVLATASKTTVYEQEAFLVTYKVYTLTNLTQCGFAKAPDFKGFHSQEVDLPRNKTFSLEHYNGRNYKTVTLNQYVLFPQQSGTLEIPSAEFDAVVAKAVHSSDPFDAFFNGGSNYVEVKKKLVTPKLTINVNPLPAGIFTSGEIKDFAAWKQLPSGEYRFILSVRDRNGKEVNNADNAVNLMLFSLAEPRPAMFVETFLYEKNTEFDATHPAVFYFGTSMQDAYVLVDVFGQKGRLESRTLSLSDSIVRMDSLRRFK